MSTPPAPQTLATSGTSPLSGRQHVLSSGSCVAVVAEVGATLRVLQVDGRDLVVPFDADEIRPFYRGSMVAPWPNRLRDGRYVWDGVEHQVPINEPERGTALHGLVSWVTWTTREVTTDTVVLTTDVVPQPGYPFPLRLQATYRARPDGLDVELVATNRGTKDAPYGCTWHPYLVGGPGRVDDWQVSLPAATVLEVEPARLLPRGERPVEGTTWDLRSAVPLRGRAIDHAYTDVTFDENGRAAAEVRGAGRGVRLEWDRDCPWVQVHTADRPEPAHDRVGLAVEPMTCPPDAFSSGRDLRRLAPGHQSRTRWWLSTLPEPSAP